MDKQYPVSSRSKLRRKPSRGSHDKEKVYEILDAGYMAYVGIVDDGQPVVIPLLYGRRDDTIILHGSVKSRIMMAIGNGADVCINVTHTDALVLAKSALHHSVNYRSVVLFGKGTEISDRDEKMEALRVITENILPGRWDECREPSEDELKAVAVVSVKIDEATAKVRTGPPVDEQKDLDLPYWAGTVDLNIRAENPVAENSDSIPLPESVKKMMNSS